MLMPDREGSGFTIVELLIVIVVIAILAAISIVAYTGIQSRAHTTAVQTDFNNNAKKLEEYKILNGEYPQTQANFRSAGLSFSVGSYQYALYCVRNTGDDPNWALIARTVGGDFYRTARQGWQSFGGGLSGATAACDAAGLTGASARAWLISNGNESPWVEG